ncbi:MAG TPA: DUF3160 domain-containing protein [Polyangia bacterium]
MRLAAPVTALCLTLAPALAAAGWPCAQRADVDGDGAPDAVVLDGAVAGVRIGAQVVPLPLAAPAVVRVCLGDLDRDGRAEVAAVVVAATDRDPTFRRRLFLYHGGRAALSPMFLGTAGGGALVDAGLADLDGDGRALVLARERTAAGERTRVYRWQGFGLVEDPALATKAPAWTPAAHGPIRPWFPAVPPPKPVLAPFKPDFERAPGRIAAAAPAPKAVNRGQFGWLPAAARAHLDRQGFVVVRPAAPPPEFHSVYLENEYRGWPSLVTADAALHLVHLLADQAIQRLEQDVLAPALAAVVERMRGQARAVADAPPDVRAAAARVAFRLDVAAALLSGELPGGAEGAAVREEVGRVLAAQAPGRQLGAIEYRDFAVRGHYTRSEALARYFRAYLWLAQPLRNDDVAGARVLVTLAGRPENLRALEMIDGFTAALAGTADRHGLATRRARVTAARHGAQPPWSGVAAEAANAAGQPGLALLPRPPAPEAGVLLGAVDLPARPLPSVLDVLAVLGSQRAAQLIAPEVARSPAVRDHLRRAAAAVQRGEGVDSQAIAGRWLLALRWLLLPFPPGYAPFQRAAAWPEHALVSAAASFTALRRDTVLYVQPPVVWMEGGRERALPPGKTGYVEPVPELYEELAAVLDRVRAAAVAAGGPGLAGADHPGRGRGPVAALEAGTELLGFLASAARAELAGRELSAVDHERLSRIGHELEGVLAGKGTLRADPVPVVADIFNLKEPGSGAARRLQVATGPVDLVVAAVVVRGRVLLARGAVSSFYTFESPRPLSDEEWRARLKGPQAPAPPAWARPLPGGAPPRVRQRD